MAATSGRSSAGRIPRAILLAAASLLAALIPAGAGAEGGEAGEAGTAGAVPLVTAVTFQVASPYKVSYEELTGLVTLRPGMRLTEEGIRESIRGLAGKAAFREIAAFVREAGGGAQILFFLRPMPVVSDVAVRGNKRLGATHVVNTSKIRRGMTMEGVDPAAAARRILDDLRAKGLPHASVEITGMCSPEDGTGSYVIQLREGEPATVMSVSFPGAAFFDAERIVDIVGVATGDAYDFRDWEEGVAALRRAYKKSGFLAVHIGAPETACVEADTDGVCLAAPVEEGPRYTVAWRGNERFRTRKLEEVSGLYGDEEVTEGGLVHDLRENILGHYRSRGYLKAEVEVSVGEEKDGVRPLQVAIREGKKGTIDTVRFEGNASIPSRRLRRQMLTSEKGPLHLLTGSGKVDEETWSADLAAVVGLYQKEGFANARIDNVDETWDEEGGITRTVRIEEGTRFTLREILFRGNHHYLKGELVPRIENREGAPVNYEALDRDAAAVAEHYRNAGFLDVAVEGTFLPDEETPGTADIRFEVAEGPRYRLGKVLVRGNVMTDPAVVLREMRIPRGEPAGEKDLIVFQQAVFGTGLYKAIRIQRVKDKASGVLDLVVEVEETLFLEIEFGGGYGTDTGLRGFVQARHLNLDGKGRRATLRAEISQKEEAYIADLREPYVLGPRWKWEGGLTGTFSDTEEESFSLTKAGIGASLNKTIWERSSVTFLYEFSRERPHDVAPGAVLGPEDVQTSIIGAVKALGVLDLRDDPFDPRGGSFHSLSTELAAIVLGSSVDYYRVSAQTSWYFPLVRRTTLAASLRGGVALPYADTVEVPIQKRLFLGGRTTVRGFGEQEIGPKGPDGEPTGGTYMVCGNLEVRVAIRGKFVLAGFIDAGSVWLSGGGPGTEFDLREGAGLGLRYVTPIGPLGLDYGWKLDRRPGESPSEWHFTIGAVF